MKHLLVLIGFLTSLGVNAQLSSDQSKQIDSLKQVITTAANDSTVINAWIAWDDIIWSVDPDLDFQLNNKIKVSCASNLKKSNSKKEKEFYKRNYAKALHNFGSIFYGKGDYAKAISYFTQSLKLKEEIGDLRGAAASINNIGNIYLERGNAKKAKEYYLRTLEISKTLKDKNAIASALSNIGLTCSNEEDFENAIHYQRKSLEIRKETGDKKGMAACLSNIGQVYNEKGEYDKALDFYSQGLKLYEEIGDKHGIGLSHNDFGLTYFLQGNYGKAIEFSNRALLVAKERGAKVQEKDTYKVLFQSYEAIKNYKKALEMHKFYTELKDSLDSEENQQEIIRQEFKYSYEKKAAADSVKAALADKVKDASLAAERAENRQHMLEAKQLEQQKYVMFAGLGIALLFGGVVYNRFRKTSKQKRTIEDQKQQVDKAFEELEEKNTEILDSINYAKRIQNAILPSAAVMKEHLKESFVFYKPKAIVAGDFYWLEHKDDKILFAVADCTGHGVPGAMVSVICNNGLNRSVREHGLTTPGEILDKTREIVIREFDKSEDDVNDGMDIALCSIDGNQLQYAGANNPLWIIRNGELIEIKADKQPIGKFDNQAPYTTNAFNLEKGDTIYIFSDGFADQFGGENDRKFKVKAFKELLLSIQSQSLGNQKEFIESSFEKWKGDHEQIDDVCVVGVRV